MTTDTLKYRKTKIVATIGPATWDQEHLEECLLAGMNVARLNFSHGTLERHSETVKAIREASRETAKPVAILQDLQGPKIRLADFKNEKCVEPGDQFWVYGPEGDPEKDIVILFEPLFDHISVGQSIFVDDGIVELKVLAIEKQKAKCEVVHGGVLRSRKGVNLPDTELNIDCLTTKDREDLKNGAPLGFDYVALSFVREPEDLLKLKTLMDECGSEARIIAKIEKKQAVENIEAIVDLADGIMIARGDLAVEIGQVHLPAVQKRITQICNRKGKPVITATQMLDSMQQNSRPTRAEITDVANAVLDGSDALMLSGESAFGKYPVRAIKTMHEITVEAEKQRSLYYRFRNREENSLVGVPESIAISTVLCAKQLKAKVIVSMSTTGKTAQQISKYRPRAQLVALTVESEALNALELLWGVRTFTVSRFKNINEAIRQVEDLLRSKNIGEPGDQVVLTLGLPVASGQKTNSMRVFTLPE